MSHSATNVKCAAVSIEWRIRSAMRRRSPRTGTRVSPGIAGSGVGAGVTGAGAAAPAGARCRSCRITRPPGPVPRTVSMRIPI